MVDSFVQIMEKGGWLMYPLLFLSILSLGIFFERLYSLRQEKFIPKLFTDKLIEALNKKDMSTAKALCSADRSSVAKVSDVILNNLDLPISRLIETTEEAGRYESRYLEKYLPTLQVIAGIAPLVGLLGTVSGMIRMFVFLSGAGVGPAQTVAAGISEALLTTAAGLTIAIPTMIFYHIVRSRAEKISDELEKSASGIINLILKEEQK